MFGGGGGDPAGGGVAATATTNGLVWGGDECGSSSSGGSLAGNGVAVAALEAARDAEAEAFEDLCLESGEDSLASALGFEK